MKDTYTIIELMKNPLTTNDIRKLKKLANEYNTKKNKAKKLMTITCPIVILLLAIISYSIFSPTVNNFDIFSIILFYISATIAICASGFAINLSIYAIYSQIIMPFRFTYKTEFRGGETTASLCLYNNMFDNAKDLDLDIINSIDLTKKFYETITKEQHRYITDIEYEIVKHLNKKLR